MTHPLIEEIDRFVASIDDLPDANTRLLTAAEKADYIRACVAAETKILAKRLTAMNDADDLIRDSSFRTMGNWLADQLGLWRSGCAADARLAAAFDTYPLLAQAMHAGTVTKDQAVVIVRSLDRLPEELDATQLSEAERHMIDNTGHQDPSRLAKVGEHLLEVIAPDEHDTLEALRLAQQEARARQGQRLTLKARGDGLTQISGRLPDDVAIRLATYLHAFTNPRRPDEVNPFGYRQPEGLNQMPYAQQAAVAFGQLLEVCDPKRLPIHGGDATTLMVTITLDKLRNDLATAGLLDAPDDESEHKLTAAQVRRLACNAGIIPVVLGSKSEVLDLGRSARLFRRAQQRALRKRDGECRTEGCHIPGTWSEAHHWVPWSHGGTTDLANAVLLCSYHHHLAHDPAWTPERLANGDVRFFLRT